jgi:hypothetical protein
MKARFASPRWTTERRRALVPTFAIVAYAATATLAACGGGGGDGGPSGPTTYKDPVGTYAVLTVNSKAVPVAVYSAPDYMYELMSSTATLTSDGKYVNAFMWRQTLPGAVSFVADTERGTWTLNASAVQFTNALDATATDRADWVNTGKLTFVEPHLGGGSDTLVYAIKK